MEDISNVGKAIDLLQQLGLKEYEAKSFVALSRLPKGTAKEISEVSDVPRTRVYDAVRVLESKGLVEIQHSNPQQFRAVSIDEAAETLREEYESRTQTLRETLRGLDRATPDDETEVTHEVWSLQGDQAIENRAGQLIDEATEEVVLVVDTETWTERLIESIHEARDRGVTVIVGARSETLRETVEGEFPDVEVFVSGLEWLGKGTVDGDETDIDRLLLVDRTSILVSTHNDSYSDANGQRAVFGRGFDNGLVAITRRLMATGLPTTADPGSDRMA